MSGCEAELSCASKIECGFGSAEEVIGSAAWSPGCVCPGAASLASNPVGAWELETSSGTLAVSEELEVGAVVAATSAC